MYAIKYQQKRSETSTEGSEQGPVGVEGTSDFKKYDENTEVQCKHCGGKYPYKHMEVHVVGVHGLDGPKEMYIDDQSSLVRSVTDIHDSKSIPHPTTERNLRKRKLSISSLPLSKRIRLESCKLKVK